jgi:hypothetical protein
MSASQVARSITTRTPLGAAACFAALVLSAIAASIVGELIGIDPKSPRDALHGSLGEIASLAAHNAGVALLPLGLLAIGWDQLRGVDHAGDALVAGMIIANGVSIGLGFARAGLELFAYLPHLPLEWAALALPAGAWVAFRAQPPRDRAQTLVYVAALTGLLVVVAAVVESLAVPVGG